MPVDGLDGGIEDGEDIAVHHRESAVGEAVFRGIELIDIRVENVEGVGIPEGAEELALALLHGLAGEAGREPRSGVGVEIPPDRVRAVGFERFERVDRVALGFRHFLSVFILHVPEDDDVLIGRAVEEERGDRHEGVEPAAGLVDGFADEVRRELRLELVLVLEGIVVLGEGHGAGVEPAVDDLGDALHLAAAFRAGERHGIDIGAVQLDVVRAVLRHGFELRDRADSVTASAGAFPDVERGAPVAVAGNRPVLHVLEPVAEAALADGFGDPVDGVVVLNEVVADGGHLDIPRFAGVVDQRRVAAPAVRVIVLELRGVEELSFVPEVFEDDGIGLLHEDPGVGRLGGHVAGAVDELYEREVIAASDAGVVFTERGRDVDDARAVAHRDIAVAGDEMAFFLLLRGAFGGAGPEGLVFAVFERGAGHLLEDLVGRSAVLCKLAEDGVEKRLCHIVGVPVGGLHLRVGLLGIDAERDVRREGPRGRGPREEVRVLALYLEADDGGAFLDGLVALGDLLSGERRAAAGAIGDDLEALVEQSLVPDLAEGPPFGFDIAVFIGHIGVFHVDPVADGAGEVLPQRISPAPGW